MAKPRAFWPGVLLFLVVALASLAGMVLGSSPRLTLAVMLQLGPIDALRCLHLSTYVYTPHGINLDGALLHERPEDVIDGSDIQRVELNLNTGQAVAWAKTLVTVLEPTQLSMISDETTNSPVCVSHLAGWQIVGTHALG